MTVKEAKAAAVCNSLPASNSRGHMATVQRAQTLNQGQFSRLIKITLATSRYFERDVLVLMLGHHCGMQVTEVSRITVAEVMNQPGKLRTETSLRETVTKGCRQRCAYLVTTPLIAALEAYVVAFGLAGVAIRAIGDAVFPAFIARKKTADAA
jgi:site-specific recombinase XerD